MSGYCISAGDFPLACLARATSCKAWSQGTHSLVAWPVTMPASVRWEVICRAPCGVPPTRAAL